MAYQSNISSYATNSKVEEEEEEEEEEEVLLKPVFVPKSARKTILSAEELAKQKEQEELREQARQEARRLDSHNLVADYIRRDLEKANLNAQSDTRVDKNDPSAVDDTDDINEEEEMQTWKLRELRRIKREIEVRKRYEAELFEIQQLRQMDDEEKDALHARHVQEKTAEKENKAKYRFLQKYYHKGAFFMDKDEEIYQRDYNEATDADKQDKLSMPAVMQVKNYGKASRSKWTHLSAEDTTSFDYGWSLNTEVSAKEISKQGGMHSDFVKPTNKKRKL